MAEPDALTAAFERVLQEERRRNSRYLNALRFGGAVVFLALKGVTDLYLFWPLPLLCVLSGVLFFAARRSERLANLSSLAVPLVDMPAVFLIQLANLSTSSNPRAVANFTLGVYVLLIMLSAFMLQKREIVVSGVIATTLLLTLQFRAHDTPTGMMGGVLVIALALLICEFAIRRRLAMAQRLAREQMQRERLGRYFSPQVAAQIQQASEDLPAAQLCEVTVLFSDLRGFTAMSERLAPSEVMALLNEIHSRSVKVVFDQGGTLDKFIGDGLMAYFGAPLTQSDHALRALRCAMEMQASLAELNSVRAAGGKPPLRLSIGLHSGMAIVGTMGPENRREFTAVGDTVNLAARLENLTRQYEDDILISGETAIRIGGAFELQQLGESKVRGRSEPVELFTPVSGARASGSRGTREP